MLSLCHRGPSAVGRDTWNKLLGKPSVNKGGCFKDWAMFKKQFFKHRSKTCVFTGVRYDFSCTILDAL